MRLWGGTRTNEDALLEARALLSAIPDGLLVLDDGAVSSVNRRLCELLGFEREELLGATAPLPFWPPEHRHEIEAWHRELDELREHETELTLRHRDGTRLRVLLAGRQAPSGPHEALRQVVTIRDVSARHRRERRLQELSSRDPETGLPYTFSALPRLRRLELQRPSPNSSGDVQRAHTVMPCLRRRYGAHQLPGKQ